MTYEEERASIIDQLRRKGWNRIDAEEEADLLMKERTERRKKEK